MTRRPPSDPDSPTLQPGPSSLARGGTARFDVPAAVGRGAANLRSRVEDPHAPVRSRVEEQHASRGLGARRAPATSAAQDRATAAPMLRDRLREVLERDRALADATRSFTHGFTQEESGTRMRMPKAKPRALDPDEIASIDALLNGDFEPTWPGAERAPAAEASTPAAQPRTAAGAGSVASPPAAPAGAEPPSAPSQPSAAWQAARSWRGPRQPRQRSSELPSGAPTTTPAGSPASIAGALPAFELSPAPELGLHREAAPVEPPALALFADWIAEEVGELAESSPAPIVLTPELAPTLHTGTLTPGAPEGEEARSGKEPIRTRTMARLLASHGYRSRALSIYDELLARRPGDTDLRAEAEALRRAPR